PDRVAIAPPAEAQRGERALLRARRGERGERVLPPAAHEALGLELREELLVALADGARGEGPVHRAAGELAARPPAREPQHPRARRARGLQRHDRVAIVTVRAEEMDGRQ